MATPFKDLFSAKGSDYARFRPTYPPALFAWLAQQAPRRTSVGGRLAVDVGTGNGQAAVALAAHFDHVVGLDPGQGQLAAAQPHPRVEYRVARADALGVADASADLVTAAQAFHWFAGAPFFDEARRVLVAGGVLAVWAYGLAAITPEIDAAVLELYEDHLGPYWEPERRLIETGYRTVDVPFAELAVPAFDMRLDWRLEDLVGYLGTWSPLPRYAREKGTDALAAVKPKLEAAWGSAGTRTVVWPLSVRAFRVG